MLYIHCGLTHAFKKYIRVIYAVSCGKQDFLYVKLDFTPFLDSI